MAFPFIAACRPSAQRARPCPCRTRLPTATRDFHTLPGGGKTGDTGRGISFSEIRAGNGARPKGRAVLVLSGGLNGLPRHDSGNESGDGDGETFFQNNSKLSATHERVFDSVS